MMVRNLDDVNETIAFVKQQMFPNPSNDLEIIHNDCLQKNLISLEDEKRKIVDTKLVEMQEIWEKYFAKYIDEYPEIEYILNPGAGIPPINIERVDIGGINITLYCKSLFEYMAYMHKIKESNTLIIKRLEYDRRYPQLRFEFVYFEGYHYKSE